MYIHAPCFNLDELARDNLHIHTSFSRCAKPEMTVENIFAEAARIGYRTIALTDHYNDDIDDEEALRRLETLREQGQKLGEPCRVLYGMELSGYGIGKTLEGDKLRNALDYRLYSCNATTIISTSGSRRRKSRRAHMPSTRWKMSPRL